MSPRDTLLEDAQSLALDSLTVGTVGLFRKNGIDALLLRGPAIGALLYDDESERRYGDVDLLVDPSRFAEAQALLEAVGFTESPTEAAFPEQRPEHAHTLRSPSGHQIDLHRTVIGAGAPPAIVWDVLAAGSTPLNIDGVEVLVPSEPARAALVALHAAQHVGRATRPEDDLNRALLRLAPATWDAAAETVAQMGALPAFAQGLSTSEVGRQELERLALAIPKSDVRSLRGGDEFHIAQGMVWFRALPTRRDKFRFVLERIFPNARRMRGQYPLARRGMVGLTAAHVVRWIRLSAALMRVVARQWRGRR